MHESRLFVEQNFVGSGLSTLATVLVRLSRPTRLRVEATQTRRRAGMGRIEID